MILLKNYFVNTTNNVDVISVIHEINRAIREAAVPAGIATILVPAAGGAVSIIEPLPDLIAKLKEAMKIFPGEGVEIKNRRKEDISVGPRVSAAMLGKSVQLPFANGRLLIAPREEVVLVDLESSGMRREFYVQIMGEAEVKQEPRQALSQRKR